MDLQYYLLSAKAENKERLKQQHLDAANTQTITCSCGQKRHLTLAFKCLYCGQWFCFSCAEQHFGKTVEEYREEERAKLREEFIGLTVDQIRERMQMRRLKNSLSVNRKEDKWLK